MLKFEELFLLMGTSANKVTDVKVQFNVNI